MELKQLFTDDNAVSPVIGVILMVAITVILAAVIGTFVLGLGDQVQNNAPQVSFTFDFNEGVTASGCDLGGDGTLNITHDGGDQVDDVRLNVTDGPNEVEFDTNASNACGVEDVAVSAGMTANAEVDSDDTVRVIWTASGGGNSATLGKWTGPDA